MRIGMHLHRLAPPRPPAPTFTIRIPTSTASGSPTAQPRSIALAFYTPPRPPKPQPHPLPLILNFHGGGFTLGAATDDARWAAALTSHVPAVCVSVDYGLAPELPFPTAVDDGVDALLWVVAHAEALGVDPMRVGVSGFSAGGNLAFSIMLRLGYRLRARKPERERGREVQEEDEGAVTGGTGGGTSSSDRPFKVLAITAFYPALDYSLPRASRRATNPRPSRELPAFLTDLFDAAYLSPPDAIDLRSPFLSPGVADDELLRRDLPADIAIYTCEWDGLCAEGLRFAERLKGLGKRVSGPVVRGVGHAWDRTPNPWRVHGEVGRCYGEACRELRRVFSGV